ncbi:MAG: DUF1772 domain-containing protein [Lewinellaceae bacterium]|nr:DUF1772 domain-containing protein [Saprospiraceae bacterium]MCB9339532.1 DUF1772 domain-containing protein [Lewinellaceae bacterium]
MATTIVRFVNVLVLALVAGAVFGIWVGYNPLSLSATAYLEQQQNAIRSLNTLMPVLGGTAGLLTLLSAWLQRQSRVDVVLLLSAFVLGIGSGLITRFGNQPINAIEMTWQPGSMPSDWTQLRDQWWSYHTMRTFTTMAMLALVVWSSIRKGNEAYPQPTS